MLHPRTTTWELLLGCSQLLAFSLLIGCGPPANLRPAQSTATTPDQAIAEANSAASLESETDVEITPFDPTALIEQSAELTRLLLAEDSDAALQQFSPAYRAQITTDALDSLSHELRRLLGTEIAQLVCVDTQLGETHSETQTQAFRVLHVVEMAGGKQAVSTVQFFLPLDAQFPLAPELVAGESAAGKSAAGEQVVGELAAIDIRETWPSYSPNTHRLARSAVEIFFPRDDNSVPVNNQPSQALEEPSEQPLGSNSSADFQALLHPDLLPHVRSSELSELIERIRQRFGGLVQQPLWSVWSYQTDGQQLSAVGSLATEHARVEIQADFSQDKLIGVTLISDTYAVSTLDLLHPQQPAAATGKLFWEHLFSDDLAAAHQLLAPAFQQELPVDQFRLAIAQSELVGSHALQNVTLDTLRFSNRLQRADPVAFTAYYMATFSDGSHQAVQCEFGSQQTPPSLLFFTNDVQATLPSSDTSRLQRTIQAFLSGQPGQVKQLLDAVGRNNFQPSVAALFLQELTRLFGQTPQLEQTRILHLYRGSLRTDHLRATLVSPKRSIVFEATMQADELKSFSFLAPELETFVREMKNFEPLEELGREFIRQWMNASQTQQAAEKMLATADPDTLLAQLAAERDNLISQHGHFLWSDLLAWQAIEGSNEVSAVYEMEFADQTLDMQLIFEVSAITAKISSASVLSETK